MKSTTVYFNIVGHQVLKLRKLRGWSQDMLCEKLVHAGWNLSKVSLENLEMRMLPVADHHLFFLAKIFDVPLREIFPKIDPQDPNLYETLNRFMSDSSWQEEG